MNRTWDNPDPVMHAPIASLKALLAKAQAQSGVEMFCDVHGHVSRTHALRAFDRVAWTDGA